MGDDPRQQNFAERLRRIEEQRSGGHTPPEQMAQPIQSSRPQSDYGYGVEQKENYRVRNGIIWAFILAAVGAGGYYGFKALPQDMVAAVAALGSSSDADNSGESSKSDGGSFGGLSALFGGGGMISMSGGSATPKDPTVSNQGAVLASPLVVHAGPEPLDLATLVSAPDLPTQDTAIGNLIPFDRNAMCTLRTPTSAEKVVNLRMENALQTAPIQAFSSEQLANRLIENIESVTQDGADYNFDSQVSGVSAAMDVFVTDTSAPIYLVLQNLGSGIVWNIHTAPDVTISHVAIVSSGLSGLVTPPDDATFEALLVSDFITGHRFGMDDEIRECMIRPWRLPEPEWPASVKAAEGNMLYENQVYSYQKGYEAYNAWYTQTLGVDAGTNLVTVRDAAHALLGPEPATPITYRPMAGADIHFMRADHLFTGDAATRKTITDDLHNTLLRAAIGGDVAALNPAPMTAEAQ